MEAINGVGRGQNATVKHCMQLATPNATCSDIAEDYVTVAMTTKYSINGSDGSDGSDEELTLHYEDVDNIPHTINIPLAQPAHTELRKTCECLWLSVSTIGSLSQLH